MERHRCKICFRKFTNGRALGGHMRSHMMNLPIPPKHDPLPPPRSLPPVRTPSCETASETSTSTPFSSSSSSDSEEVAEPTGSSSLITLQDRESETESLRTKDNPTRKRRSKRMIKKLSSSTSSDYQHYYHTDDVHQVVEADPPGSSVSEVTSDEDLAFCLMMLSRDKWNGTSTTRTTKKKYKCDTCNKSFKSYQALGGHRASHKKLRVFDDKQRSNHDLSYEDREYFQKEDGIVRKVHECPVCLRMFASGQALGGHKRSHVLVANGGNIGISNSSKKVISGVNDSLIDLNLPAPVDDEDDSAVSDVHF